MAIARDWLKTLWPASYKGVPFFVETDEEEGGRRIVIHEFPMRDDPFLEDLGEAKRGFSLTGYVASDSADSDAAAVIAICATRGPGSLVLPTHGPLIVRCLTFKRNRSKDRSGYIALDLTFVREGAATALISVAGLANLIFVQADNAALTAALSFASSIAVANQPDFVQAAAVNGVQDNASALEMVRSSVTVDPTVSSAQRTEIQSIFDAASNVLSGTPIVGSTVYVTTAGQNANSPAVDIAARLIASARALGTGTPADQAIPAFEGVFTDAQIVVPAPLYVTPTTTAEVNNQTVSYQALRIMALIAYSEAIARISLPDRPRAITLRANVAEYFESELLLINAANIDLAHALMNLRDATINYLSRAILDLAPVITVDANLTMPSLFWAWRLYQDPTRSTELAQRNLVPHPSFMPTEFEALAR